MTMAMVITPAKTMSVRKCRPNTTRMAPTAVPNSTAPPSAKGLICGGASEAGATVQKAWLASPDTKEQFRLQALLGCHHGWKVSEPANCCTKFGRGRPQFSLRRRLLVSPGPSRKEPMRNTTTDGAMSILELGKASLRNSTNTAGASRRKGIQLAMRRIMLAE